MSAPRIALIDNRDSFTFNIYQYGRIAGAEVEVIACEDAPGRIDAIARADGVILSPGPGTPEEAVESRAVLSACEGRMPVLGVCLGHQVIALHHGARVGRAGRVMHGKTSVVRHDGAGLFAGLAPRVEVARYHSLLVARESLPPDLVVTCETDDPGEAPEVMGLRHATQEVHGIQFHPEAILTPDGQAMIGNFVEMCRGGG